MPQNLPGRHRAPRRSVLRPLARASAVLVVSGGLVTTASATAQATPSAAPVPSAVPSVAAAVVQARHTAWRTVRYGSRGAAVRSIQRIVGAHADGVFGWHTRTAVQRWQARHHLVRDGIVGPRTAVAMGLTRARVTVASRSKVRSAPVKQGVLSLARKYTGIRYRWGGSTPSGFDCSGYTSYVFRKAGVNLPRTAGAQQRATHRVSHPRPGDLVFYGKPAYHVGIYAGAGYMYDAGKPGLKTQRRKIFAGVSGYGRI